MPAALSSGGRGFDTRMGRSATTGRTPVAARGRLVLPQHGCSEIDGRRATPSDRDCEAATGSSRPWRTQLTGEVPGRDATRPAPLRANTTQPGLITSPTSGDRTAPR